MVVNPMLKRNYCILSILCCLVGSILLVACSDTVTSSIGEETTSGTGSGIVSPSDENSEVSTNKDTPSSSEDNEIPDTNSEQVDTTEPQQPTIDNDASAEDNTNNNEDMNQEQTPPTSDTVPGIPAKEELNMDKIDLENFAYHKEVLVPGMIASGTKGTDVVFGYECYITVSSFYIGAYEVTQDLYFEVMRDNAYNIYRTPSYFKNQTTSTTTYEQWLEASVKVGYPVESVTWYDAVYFCNRLSDRTGLDKAYTMENIVVSGGHITSADVTLDMSKNGYRLPTETEWETAARGGNPNDSTNWNYTYAGSDNINDVAWYSSNSDYETHRVGTKAQNKLGLYDMSGNVWEWCWDYLRGLSSRTETNPTGNDTGFFRMERGGRWGSRNYECAVDYRDMYNEPNTARSCLGFRICRSVQ